MGFLQDYSDNDKSSAFLSVRIQVQEDRIFDAMVAIVWPWNEKMNEPEVGTQRAGYCSINHLGSHLLPARLNIPFLRVKSILTDKMSYIIFYETAYNFTIITSKNLSFYFYIVIN